MQKILGLDYGKKRIGVAISDETGVFAFPLEVLENNQEFFSKISELIKKDEIQVVVVGDPGENEIKKEVNLFIDKIKDMGVSVFLEKEFMTSLHTDIFTKTKPIARQTKKEILPKKDHSAAALILQRYLDKQKFKK